MKAAARRVLNACTRAITPSDLSSRSQAICEHVGSLAVFKRANSVALYLAMPGGEVQTQALLDAALGEGKTVWVPKVDFLTGRMDMYPVASHAAVAALPQNKWGIPEPGQSTVSALRGNGDPLDLVIVPGLGFDCSGGRIGRGKGYYDTFLHSLASLYRERDVPPPLLLGVCFDVQLVEGGVPREDHDILMDLIVSESGVQFRAPDVPLEE